MALPIRIARAIVGVVKETTPYTFSEPANTDSWHAENIVIKPTQETTKRHDTRAHFGLLDDIPGGAECEISFEIYLVGAAAAGTDPFWHNAMMGAGHQRITVAATSVTYKPCTTFDGSGTTTLKPSEVYSCCVWEENGGPRYALRGGQGNVQITAKQGQPLKMKFTFKGSYEPVIDDATPPTVTDSSLVPPTLLSAGISVHGVSTLAFDGFDFDKGNKLSRRADSNNASGIKGEWITEHDPTIKIEPEMVTVATLDMFGKWRSGATGVFTTGVIPASGGTAGNKVQIVANRVQFSEMGLGEREGGRTVPLTLGISTAAAAVDGDDYSIILT